MRGLPLAVAREARARIARAWFCMSCIFALFVGSLAVVSIGIAAGVMICSVGAVDASAVGEDGTLPGVSALLSQQGMRQDIPGSRPKPEIAVSTSWGTSNHGSSKPFGDV